MHLEKEGGDGRWKLAGKPGGSHTRDVFDVVIGEENIGELLVKFITNNNVEPLSNGHD